VPSQPVTSPVDPSLEVGAVSSAHRLAASPAGAPVIDSARLEPLLVRRISELTIRVEQGDGEVWPALCESVLALQALQVIGSPERQGRRLTTREMALRLGVKPKSLRRMVAEKRIQPAVKDGRFVRWNGQERPGGGGERS